MNNSVIIKSGSYTATILTFGAELCSLKHEPSNTEFIWQADKSIWPRHAPLLFPFVGRLKNFEYRHEGKSYTIEQHGFARDLEFNIISQTTDTVVMELKDSTYTMPRYPFQFSFKIKYTLDKNKLSMGFEVANKGQATMPVSFGGHPAFNISNPEDAIIEFEKDKNPESWLLEENFISNKTKTVTDGLGKILVNKNTFAQDALIFKNLKSRWVKLESKSTKKSIKVTFEGWPYLGIWAKPNSNFICIEPWQGLADSEDFEGDVFQKEGIIMLPSKDQIEKIFEIEVNS